MVFTRLLPPCTQPCTEQGVKKVKISIWDILNFLALTDIKDFGHMQLFTMLLLIDLALLFTPKMFLFSISLLFVRDSKKIL